MPNIKSAMKRIRSDKKKKERNQNMLSELKTMKKNLLKFQSEPEKAKAHAAKMISRFDQAAGKGIIPKGRANRSKSRIQAFIAKLSPKTATVKAVKKPAKKA